MTGTTPAQIDPLALALARHVRRLERLAALAGGMKSDQAREALEIALARAGAANAGIISTPCDCSPTPDGWPLYPHGGQN